MFTSWLGDSDTPQAPCSGFLWKKKRRTTANSGSNGNSGGSGGSLLGGSEWTKRWFTLEGRFLRWRWSSLSSEASGSIDLRDVISLREMHDKSQQEQTDFALQTEARCFYLRAPSGSEARRWVRALQMYSDRAKGGDGTGIISSGAFSPRRTETSSVGGSIERRIDATLEALNELETITGEDKQDPRGDRPKVAKGKTMPPSSPRHPRAPRSLREGEGRATENADSNRTRFVPAEGTSLFIARDESFLDDDDDDDDGDRSEYSRRRGIETTTSGSSVSFIAPTKTKPKGKLYELKDAWA